MEACEMIIVTKNTPVKLSKRKGQGKMVFQK